MEKADIAMAILGPKKAESMEDDDMGADPLQMAAAEVMSAIKQNDAKALAEALRAAVQSCGVNGDED